MNRLDIPGIKKRKSLRCGICFVSCLLFLSGCRKEKLRLENAENTQNTVNAQNSENGENLSEENSEKGWNPADMEDAEEEWDLSDMEDSIEHEPDIEYKSESVFEINGHMIRFAVPDGLYSTGIQDDNEWMYENFYDEVCGGYSVTVSTLIIYDDLADYARAVYSDIKTTMPDSSRISMPTEVTIAGNTVVYYTVSHVNEDHVCFRYIYAGTLLPDGTAFEVVAKEIDEDGEFGFERIRDFFEMSLDEP